MFWIKNKRVGAGIISPDRLVMISDDSTIVLIINEAKGF